MKKINRICHNPQSVTSTFIITNLFFLLFLLGTNPASAQGNSKAGQWAKAGGEIILSGNHNFTQTWSSHAYSRQDNNKYWPGGFWGKREPQIPFDAVVKNSVYPLKGQITVLGPGNIGLFQKGKKGARIVMNDSETKIGFVPWTNTIGTLKDYNVNGEFWGAVPAGTEITLDITAIMSMYNNQGGTGEISFIAPQEIEYEIWYFPREGGKVISVSEVNVFGEIDSDEPKGEKNLGKPLGYIMTIMGSENGTIERMKSVKDITGEKLKKGDVIYENDILLSRNVMVKVSMYYPDNPFVMMKYNTKIKFTKRAYNKPGGIINFFGKLFFKGSGTDHRGFKIVTSNAITGCEGTEFETTYNPETGETSVSVFEGIVSFECNTGTAAPVYLKAGMSASMDKNCNITSDNSIFNNANTINSGNTFYPIADSHVYAYSYLNWNKANWGKYNIISAGWNPTGGEKRAYLKFDVSEIDKATFKKATLKLYHYHTAGSNSAYLGVYTVRSTWNEGNGNYKPANVATHREICWINQPQTDQYPVAYFNPGTQTNDFVEVDITALVKSWLEGMPNHGLAIKVGENYLNGPMSVYGFYAREHEDIDKRPHIVLNGGSGSIQEPQLGQNTNVIIDAKNRYPWVIGQYNGIHYGTGTGWKQQSGGGKGKDIAIDGNNRPWVIGSDNGIYYHNGNKWIEYPGGGRGYALAVSLNGTPWVIRTNNHIYYGTGSGWVEQPGNGIAKDIAIDRQGKPWLVGMNNGIFYYEGNRWIEYPGGGRGSKLAISPNGVPWVVGNDKDIFYHDGNRWVRQPGGKIIAKDIAVDDQNRPWVLKSDNRIFYHNGNNWIEYPGGGKGLAIAISSNKNFEPIPSSNNIIGNSAIPSVAGEWELTCIGDVIFKFNVKLVQSGNGFYGDMVQTNGYSKPSKIEGEVLSVDRIKFTRSIGNWKQYYTGEINQKSGSRATSFEGMFGFKDQLNYEWYAKAITGSSSNNPVPITGQWNFNQSNGYNGAIILEQNSSGRITGNAIWNGYLKGTIDGHVYENSIEFTISYPNGDKGFYKGTLTQNGNRIINGTVKGNNGVTATWYGSK
ncbi:MAG: DNRLRE domain-containing protein [Lutibacter sp.]|uniref:DNRLRE domain-containing protein n=1 Tax=Lutibacter sp. TaxID=1925666 RepID=UPI00385D840B